VEKIEIIKIRLFGKKAGENLPFYIERMLPKCYHFLIQLDKKQSKPIDVICRFSACFGGS
jgi:hypothetical protein